MEPIVTLARFNFQIFVKIKTILIDNAVLNARSSLYVVKVKFTRVFCQKKNLRE